MIMALTRSTIQDDKDNHTVGERVSPVPSQMGKGLSARIQESWFVQCTKEMCAFMLTLFTLSRFALSFSDYAKDNIINSIKTGIPFACTWVCVCMRVTNTTDSTI